MTYEKIVSTVKKALAKADASKVKTTVAVQVDIVGEGEGAFYVKVDDGKLDVEPYEYYDHDAKLIVSAKDCVDLFGGKLDVVKAYQDGSIRVEGNIEKLLGLKEMIPAAAAKKAAPAKKAAKPAAKKAAPAKKAAAKPAAKKAEPAKKAESVKAEAKVAEKKVEVKAAEKKPVAKKAAPAKKAAKPAAKKAEPAKAVAKAPAKKATPAKKAPAKKATK